ncbi:unnamed protein product [Cunninghamella echinulata]
MLPLSLLNAAAGHPMLVELKNGETFNGHLVNCDNWMNLTLRNTIKYLNVPEEIVDIVKEEEAGRQRHLNNSRGRGRGRDNTGRGGRNSGNMNRGGRGGRGGRS